MNTYRMRLKTRSWVGDRVKWQNPPRRKLQMPPKYYRHSMTNRASIPGFPARATAELLSHNIYAHTKHATAAPRLWKGLSSLACLACLLQHSNLPSLWGIEVVSDHTDVVAAIPLSLSLGTNCILTRQSTRIGEGAQSDTLVMLGSWFLVTLRALFVQFGPKPQMLLSLRKSLMSLSWKVEWQHVT